MARTVIRSFVARDAAAGTMVVLQTGDLVDQYHIERSLLPDIEDGVYVVSFQNSGRNLRCPLARFQARTESTAGESMQEPQSARAAVGSDR